MITTSDVVDAACSCYACAFDFAVPSRVLHAWKESGCIFYCPSCGRKQHYTNQSEADRERRRRKLAEADLHRERARHDQTRADRDSAKRQLSAQKGVTTRIKNRVSKGVCPCCNRTFQNLGRHMATQHPGYSEQCDA